jgi:outer membrane scaffolding protein for murein synthesis (MipA/OmpV family)
MAGLKHLLPIGKKITLTSDTAIGYADSKYNEYYFTVDKAALNDWSSGVTINYAYTDKVGVVTGIRYMTLIDDEIRDGSSEYFLGRDMIIGRVGMILTF